MPPPRESKFTAFQTSEALCYPNMGSAGREVSIMTGAAIKLLLDVGQEAEMTRPGGDLMTMELSRLGQQLQAALGGTL